MDLKDFIKGTISAISNAIVESQTELEGIGVIVNPEKTEVGKEGRILLRSDGWRYIQELNFDVSVEVQDKNGGGANAQLVIAGLISIGGGANESNQNRSQNRISFSIPVAFSATPTPIEYKSQKKQQKA